MAAALKDAGPPQSWGTTTIGALCAVNPSVFVGPVEAESQVSFIPMAAVEAKTGRIDLSQVRPYGKVSKGYTRFSEGDVLFAKITPCMENGKIAIARGLTNGHGCGSTEFHVLRPHNGLSRNFLNYFLLQDEFRNDAQRNMAGTAGQLRVPASWLSEAKVPLPPLVEQHRIVAEIETQFTRLDASVAALRRAQANLKRYRASVLKDACEGRLVPTEAELARSEGREYEPADVLLERILAERRARWESQEKRRGKYKEPSAPDTSALTELPDGWVWATVERLIVEPLANGRSVKTVGEGFPVLRLTALREGEIDETEHKIGKWTAQQAEPFLIQKGDFFVSRGSGSIRLVGIGGLVREVESAVAFPDTMIRFRLNEFVLKHYFKLVWNSYVVRAQVEASARTTAGIYKVNQQDLASMTIPLPPLDEQRRIVDILNRAARIEALRRRAGERLREFVPALFVTMFGPIDDIGERFPCLPLQEVVVIASGATKGRKIDPQDAIKVPDLRVANVQDGF